MHAKEFIIRCNKQVLGSWSEWNMVEHTYFVNGIPALCEALKKAGRDEEAQNLVKQFLTASFNEDLDKKAERFLDLAFVLSKFSNLF